MCDPPKYWNAIKSEIMLSKLLLSLWSKQNTHAKATGSTEKCAKVQKYNNSDMPFSGLILLIGLVDIVVKIFLVRGCVAASEFYF